MTDGFKLIRDRDAWATIRGYVYQIETTIMRWLDLGPEDALELERGEDIDVVNSQLRTLEQIKVREGSLTLKSKEANEALASFYEHLKNNTQVNLMFRFVTNSKNGKENSPWPMDEKAIDVWESVRQRKLDEEKLSKALGNIRRFLCSINRPKQFNKQTWVNWINFLRGASESELLNFIDRFEWALYSSEPADLKEEIERILIQMNYANSVEAARKIFESLFCYLFRLLSTKGIKTVNKHKLSEVIETFKPSASEETIYKFLHEFSTMIEDHEARLSMVEGIISKDGYQDGPIWNVPFKPNPHFVGRNVHLQDLREKLQSGNITAITQTISGIGGVGKTQLVVQYAHHFRKNYGIVRWINADNEETIKIGLYNLAVRINIKVESIDDSVCKILDWLARRNDWLLVFDNANNYSELERYLPNPQEGHILITSRSQNWLNEPVVLSYFTTSESIEFLMRRTNCKDSEQEKAAELLAIELGHLPLALEHAAAYIRNKRKTFAEYLAMYQQRKLDFLTLEGTPNFYHSTILTTWDITLETMRSESQVAVEALQIFAFLAADDIPFDLVLERFGGANIDEIQKDQAIEVLTNYSLVAFDVAKRHASIHRLVQEVIKYRMSEDGRQHFLIQSVNLLSEKFIFNQYNVDSWEQCKTLLPHVLNIVKYIKEISFVNREVVILLHNLGLYYNHFANYHEAKEYLLLAKLYCEKVYTEGMLAVLNALSVTYLNLQDFIMAETYIDEALKLHKTSDKVRATLLSNKANILMKVRKEYKLALELFISALDIEHAIFKSDNQHTAVTRNNMAECLKAMGKYEDAKVQQEITITIERELAKETGKVNPNLATRLSNYGGTLRKLNIIPEALSSYEEALEILDIVYDGDDYRKAFVMAEYSGALISAGRYQDAFDTVKDALKILYGTLGENHPQTKEVEILFLTVRMLIEKQK